MKNIVNLVTTSGVGRHLLREFFAALGYRALPHSILTQPNVRKVIETIKEDKLCIEHFRDIKHIINVFGNDIKYLCFIRNPYSMYVSVKQRSGKIWTESIAQHYENVNYIKTQGLDSKIVKYEDFCKKESCMDDIARWVNVDRPKETWLLAQSPWKLAPLINYTSKLDPIQPYAKQYEYTYRNRTLFVVVWDAMKNSVRDVVLIWQAFMGNVKSHNAIGRHKLSFPATMLRYALYLITGFRFRKRFIELINDSTKEWYISL